MTKKYNCYERTKKEGHTKSLVHGRMDEVICHDMRKFVWTQFEEKLKKKIKKKKEEVDITDTADSLIPDVWKNEKNK